MRTYLHGKLPGLRRSALPFVYGDAAASTSRAVLGSLGWSRERARTRADRRDDAASGRLPLGGAVGSTACEILRPGKHI